MSAPTNLNNFGNPIVPEIGDPDSLGTTTENRISYRVDELEDAVDELEANVAVNVAACATADGSDAGTTQALANALKVKVNAILTALKNAGLMVADT